MKINKKNLFTMFSVVIAILFSCLKISFGLGSNRIFFSGINFILPTLGSFLGTTFSAIFIPLFFILKKISFGGALTLGIPTFVSSLFFSLAVKNNSKKSLAIEIGKFILSVVLPLFCILLFIIHPIGNQACLYSFYWFIPIILYSLDKFKIARSVFSISLITTFIAHAVGSLIWLYVFNLSAAQWLSLIPLVAVERLVFACGISLSFYILRAMSIGFKVLFRRKLVFKFVR